MNSVDVKTKQERIVILDSSDKSLDDVNGIQENGWRLKVRLEEKCHAPFERLI